MTDYCAPWITRWRLLFFSMILIYFVLIVNSNLVDLNHTSFALLGLFPDGWPQLCNWSIRFIGCRASASCLRRARSICWHWGRVVSHDGCDGGRWPWPGPGHSECRGKWRWLWRQRDEMCLWLWAWWWIHDLLWPMQVGLQSSRVLYVYFTVHMLVFYSFCLWMVVFSIWLQHFVCSFVLRTSEFVLGGGQFLQYWNLKSNCKHWYFTITFLILLNLVIDVICFIFLTRKFS